MCVGRIRVEKCIYVCFLRAAATFDFGWDHGHVICSSEIIRHPIQYIIHHFHTKEKRKILKKTLNKFIPTKTLTTTEKLKENGKYRIY